MDATWPPRQLSPKRTNWTWRVENLQSVPTAAMISSWRWPTRTTACLMPAFCAQFYYLFLGWSGKYISWSKTEKKKKELTKNQRERWFNPRSLPIFQPKKYKSNKSIHSNPQEKGRKYFFEEKKIFFHNKKSKLMTRTSSPTSTWEMRCMCPSLISELGKSNLSLSWDNEAAVTRTRSCWLWAALWALASDLFWCKDWKKFQERFPHCSGLTLWLELQPEEMQGFGFRA
jgi:hypothetical protein